ncbi:MAG: YihY/virulence factor BrkB family protein [Actinomycetota bacterium]|nr:YihY/virulence factor BrkB family protein [Actinomycetota bacterium]
MNTARVGAIPAQLLQRIYQRIPPILRRLVDEWQDDRVGGLAAEVAFFAVLSLLPGTLAVAAGLGSLDQLFGTELAMRAQTAVVDFLRLVLTEQASATIDAVRELFTTGHGGLFSFALVGALFAFSRGVFGAMRALDVVYDLPPSGSWLRSRAKAVVLSIGTIAVFALLLSIVVVGPLFGAGIARAGALGLSRSVSTLWYWLRYPLALALVFGWAVALLQFGPSQRLPWSRAIPGALLAGGLWMAASIGFRAYLVLATQINQIFGALGGALILMIWFYLLSLALLMGGEFNKALAARSGQSVASPPAP